MQVKNLFKVIFISVLAGSIIAGGVYAFLKIKSGAEVYRADLFALVPTDSDFLFYSRKPEDLPDHLPASLFPDKSCFLLARSLYSECGNDVNISGNNEILLSFKGDDGLIFYRATPQDVRAWENERVKKQKFLFSPQKETYKDAAISVYLTAEDRFFCFTHYRGAFIGSFSKSMIYKALNMYEAQETLESNTSFNTAMKISGEKVLASCFFKKEHWFSFDLSCNNGNYWANGCLLPAYTSAELYRFLNVPAAQHEIDPEVLPETTSGLVFTNTSYDSIAIDKSNRKDSLLLKHATGNISLVYYADTNQYSHKAICVELKSDRAFLKDLSSGVIPNGNDMHLKMAGDSNVYVFTFYKQYLLLAHSKESLKIYLDLIQSGRTFDKNPLYKLYSDNKNADASVSVLLGGSRSLKHPECCREIIPNYFLLNDKGRDFCVFVQFDREEELVYYSVLLTIPSPS